MGTTILLLRHGETEANSKGVLQGQSESKLTANGREQAMALGAAIASHRVGKLRMPLCSTLYASDLSRASDTAQAVVDALGDTHHGLVLKRDVRLRERRLGPFQGLTVSQCASNHRALWRAFNSGDDTMLRACSGEPGAGENGGVETHDEMFARTAAVMTDIAAAHPGETVLVVSHGGFVHTAVCALSDLPDCEIPHIGNCSVTTLIAPDTGSGSQAWRAAAIGESATGDAQHGLSQSHRINVDMASRKVM